MSRDGGVFSGVVAVLVVVTVIGIALAGGPDKHPDGDDKTRSSSRPVKPAASRDDEPEPEATRRRRFPSCKPTTTYCVRRRARFRARQNALPANRDTYGVAYFTCSLGTVAELARDYKTQADPFAVAEAVGGTYIDALEIVAEAACLDALGDMGQL